MAKQEKFGVLIEGKETVSPAAKKAERGFKKFGSAVAAVKVQIVAFVAAMYTAVRVISSAVKAFASQEQAVARLTQALKNQNEYTRANIRELTDQAKALQKLTVFGDEQIISGQAMLASFALTTKQLKEMTPRLLDVATMTAKTTGEMMDLEGAAKFVGMALGGQAGRLTQAGIRLNDYQKASFQAANETERFNMLIEIFDQNAAGLAISVGETATASVKKLKNAFFDLNEQVGKAVLKGFEGDVKLLTKAMQDLTGTEKDEVFWRKESVVAGKQQLENWEKLKDLLEKIGIIRRKSINETREWTEVDIKLADALLERYAQLKAGLDVYNEAYFKQEGLNNILNDAIKIGKGKTEADRLQIQAVLDLTQEIKNYKAEIIKSGEVDDVKIKKIMDMVAALEKLKGITEELTAAEQARANVYRTAGGDIRILGRETFFAGGREFTTQEAASAYEEQRNEADTT